MDITIVTIPVIKRENGTIKVHFVDVIVDVALGMMMATIFVKIAFNMFFATSTSGWDSNTIILWTALPWIAIAAIFIAFLRYARNPAAF